MRIDFYVLTSAETDERLRYAVRLSEKAWQQQCRVVLLA
jgi:DNA polymerase IIIc chi subunit